MNEPVANSIFDTPEPRASEAEPAPAVVAPGTPFVPYILPNPEAPSSDTHIDEFLVCSGQDEVLHDWKCRNIESRMKLLQATGEKAESLGQLIPLGHFERLQAVDPQGRMVMVMTPDRKVFLRSHPLALNTADTTLES